jgi:hypothetical protein
MTLVRNRPILSVLLMAGLLSSGCSQKKPVVSVPQTPASPASQPPAQPANEQAQPQQAQTSATQGTPPPEPQPAPAQPQGTQPAADKADSAKAKTAKPHANGKKTTEVARNHTRTTVKDEDEGAPATGPISPGLSSTETVHNQTTTDQLLQSTEATLGGIKRQLSQDEQAIVTQIRDYMNQSRQAIKTNDLTRAYNLALKARLLSDDLAKRR